MPCPISRTLSLVREETGLDVLTIYNTMPLICVYVFEHMWFVKQGIDCKWHGDQTVEEAVHDLLISS